MESFPSVTPCNINEIIDDMNMFTDELIRIYIINYSTPTLVHYELSSHHRNRFILPKFMTGDITCTEICDYGLLNWLQFAHVNNCVWDEVTCIFAARNKSSECLQYLHTNNCHWDERTCYESTLYRSSECVRYAVLNGCPCNRQQCLNTFSYLANSNLYNSLLFGEYIYETENDEIYFQGINERTIFNTINEVQSIDDKPDYEEMMMEFMPILSN